MRMRVKKKDLTWGLLIYWHFRTLFVYLSQKKIRSYLDDDDKASLQEKGHLPVKDIHHKISITFAGVRFDFAS